MGLTFTLSDGASDAVSQLTKQIGCSKAEAVRMGLAALAERYRMTGTQALLANPDGVSLVPDDLTEHVLEEVLGDVGGDIPPDDDTQTEIPAVPAGEAATEVSEADEIPETLETGPGFTENPHSDLPL